MENVSLFGPLRSEVMEALRQSSWFRALQQRSASSAGGPDPLEMVMDAAALQRFAAGEVVLRKGEVSDCLHVLVRGVAVAHLGEVRGEGATRMNPPEAFGEVGLLLKEARTATVVAETEVLTLRLEASAFRTLFQTVPEFGLETSRHLAERLRQRSGPLALP